MAQAAYPVGEGPDGFYFPAPSRATRRWGTRCPRATRETKFGLDDRLIDCESGLEGKAAAAFMGRLDVVDVREQPPALRYVDDDGDVQKHTIDLLVTLRDGTRVAVLVKPRVIADRHRLDRVRDLLANQTPRSFADRYVIVTEDKLPRSVVSNGQLYADVRRFGPSADHPSVQAVLAVVTQPMSVSAVVVNVGVGTLRALARCVLDGVLIVEGGGALDHHASVRPLDAVRRVAA